MANMQLWCNHKQTWVQTDLDVVGPTTSSTLRTLSNPTPTDLNTIFLAPNGNDANPGTLASPVLTFDHAISLMSSTFSTLQIIRNGYVGDLTFVTNSITSLITHNTIIQVELGEIATLYFDNTAGNVMSFINVDRTKISQINGLNLIFRYVDITSDVNTTLPLGIGTLAWCKVELASTFITTGATHTATIIALSNFLASIFDVSGYDLIPRNGVFGDGATLILLEWKTGTQTVLNSIFQGITTQKGGGVSALLTQNETINITHNVFDMACNMFFFGPNAGANTITINVADNIFNQPLKLIDTTSVNPISSYTINNNMFNANKPVSYSGFNGAIFGSIIQPPYVYNGYLHPAINFVNNIYNTLPRFINPLANDYHLMDSRRLTPDGSVYYSFTSMAVYNPGLAQVPGDDTRDLGPYNVTYTLAADTWEQVEFKPGFFNGETKIVHKLANFQSFYNVRGDAMRSYDGLKRHIELGLSSDAWVGTYESYLLVKILKALGAKRWYPNGLEGIFAELNSVITALSGSQFQATLPTLPFPLQLHYYEGYICELFDGVNTFALRIVDNDAYSLVLEDHRGNQATFTAGMYQLKCLYLAVEIIMDSMEQDFPYWASKNNPLYPQTDFWGTKDVTDTSREEGHIRSVILEEAELDL